MKITSYLPIFNGFYGTFFQTDVEERIIENYNEDNNTDLNSDSFEFDYASHRIEIAKKCCEVVQDWLSELGFVVTIKYKDIWSPPEYNFANDHIDVKYALTSATFKKLIKYTKDHNKAFAEYLFENFTSRDGYESFTSTNINIWWGYYLTKHAKNFGLYFYHLLNFILQDEGYSDEELAELCHEQTNDLDYRIKK